VFAGGVDHRQCFQIPDSLVFPPFYWVLKKGKERKRNRKERKEGISQHHHPLDSNIINLDKRFPFQCEIVKVFSRA